jgi:hypothetical protein
MGFAGHERGRRGLHSISHGIDVRLGCVLGLFGHAHGFTRLGVLRVVGAWSTLFARYPQLGWIKTWGISIASVATALVTDPDDGDFRQEAYDVGLQLDLQLQVMHRLPMMLSVGYAHGFEGNGAGKDEWMVSFKVL